MVQKKDVIRVISERLDITQTLAQTIVQKFLDEITETIAQSGRIELRNFGVFEVKQRAARVGRNPKTGETVKVKAKTVVGFKAGRIMQQKVTGIAKKRKKNAN
ncbi:MAG: HU family DNA-binding protein [Thermoguttaceae bacterium]